MKKLLGLFMIGLLAAGMGCGKKESKPGAVTPRAVSEPVRGPNERFYTIQQKLDSGGNFYMYADLKDVLHNFMDKMQANFTGPQMPPEAAKAFMIANQVIDRLGLYGINDLGMSVVPDGSLKRSKIVISDANGRKKGLLSLLGGSPHPFPMLDRVSSDTLLLATGDLDTSASWALIRQITQDLGGIDALAQMDKALGQLAQQSGINVPAILPTLGGEFTLAMAQDRASKLSIPAGARPIVIDSPRLALMVRVKDDTLYQAFKTLLTQKARATETTDGKLRKVLIPAPSNPIWSVSPVLASDGSYVYLATHDDYLRQLTSAPAGASLRQAAEFKDLSQGLPTEGNALFFVSKQLKTEAAQVMEQVALMNQGQPGQNPAALMELFKQMKESSSGAIMIRVNEPDGLLMVGRSDSSALQLAPALTIAPAALLAAIAVPNFMEAQTRSKVSRAKADMRTMATALECYYIDNNSYAATSVDPARNAYGSLGQSDPALRQQPTFMTSSPERAIMTLTTPVAYITGYMPDPFKKDKGATFSYYTTGTGWILWSPGPDGKYELNQENIGKLYDPSGKVPAADLIERTFDPTNGTASPGDIWRTKQ